MARCTSVGGADYPDVADSGTFHAIAEASYDGVTWFPAAYDPGVAPGNGPLGADMLWTENPLTRGMPDTGYIRFFYTPPAGLPAVPNVACSMGLAVRPDEYLDAVWVNGVAITQYHDSQIPGVGTYQDFPLRMYPGQGPPFFYWVDVPDDLITDGAPMEFVFKGRHDLSECLGDPECEAQYDPDSAGIGVRLLIGAGPLPLGFPFASVLVG